MHDAEGLRIDHQDSQRRHAIQVGDCPRYAVCPCLHTQVVRNQSERGQGSILKLEGDNSVSKWELVERIIVHHID